MKQESGDTPMAAFIPGKRKYLFCFDEIGMSLLEKIMADIRAKDIPFEIFHFSHQESALPAWLSSQKMGCYLYIAVSRKYLYQIMCLAEAAGFSEEEVQLIGYGDKEIHLFCCRCHSITELAAAANKHAEQLCSCCGLLLTVSSHYSPLRNAYLGYPAII
ncbi:hypothetical protein JOC77_003069 [Peribacillus deserti]|uniref:Dimethylamine monooxygenase subunit DmmA-like C-terminal domain-containing protein n=1 Tax=Peribacillus deserti TaxID=673318 RepID=A0ABS2QKZ8_9BACI|nr:hypothetical protein [Peribacillus deserti]MBM7693625.1 hypothetical protein [Peribacillus deserti]